ncbi:MAG: hypothetical protein FWG10_04210 [Eubacteriaceae bacterium]|nr:hypothetical protein [Eubacteriaceae bacterium]
MTRSNGLDLSRKSCDWKGRRLFEAKNLNPILLKGTNEPLEQAGQPTYLDISRQERKEALAHKPNRFGLAIISTLFLSKI